MVRLKILLLAMLGATLIGCGSTEPGEAILLQVELTQTDADAGLVRGTMRNAGDVSLLHGACPAMLQRNTGSGWMNVSDDGTPSCPAIGIVLEPGKRFEFAVPAPAGVRGCQYRLQVSALPHRDGASPPEGDRELLLGNSAPFCLD